MTKCLFCLFSVPSWSIVDKNDMVCQLAVNLMCQDTDKIQFSTKLGDLYDVEEGTAALHS